MPTVEKCNRFRALHAADGAFVIPNAWDAGSALILEAIGFQAIATTSAGFAFSVGRPDGQTNRAETLANAQAIVEACGLPVSADLEGGFGDQPEACARTIEQAAGIGLVGGSIEDATGDPAKPIYDFSHSVERIEAAVAAASGRPFVLTARAENFLHGRADLDDTIRRLQAFEKAGAEVLYAPGLPDIEAIRTVCASVSRPVNVVMGLKGRNYSVEELAGAGVKRISVGGSFARTAYGAFIRAAREVAENGTFTFAADAVPHAEMMRYMARGDQGKAAS
jgi:2-methylisocitrate lyase-like PEP mutase family enzyme